MQQVSATVIVLFKIKSYIKVDRKKIQRTSVIYARSLSKVVAKQLESCREYGRAFINKRDKISVKGSDDSLWLEKEWLSG